MKGTECFDSLVDQVLDGVSGGDVGDNADSGAFTVLRVEGGDEGVHPRFLFYLLEAGVEGKARADVSFDIVDANAMIFGGEAAGYRFSADIMSVLGWVVLTGCRHTCHGHCPSQLLLFSPCWCSLVKPDSEESMSMEIVRLGPQSDLSTDERVRCLCWMSVVPAIKPLEDP